MITSRADQLGRMREAAEAAATTERELADTLRGTGATLDAVEAAGLSNGLVISVAR